LICAQLRSDSKKFFIRNYQLLKNVKLFCSPAKLHKKMLNVNNPKN